MIGRTIGTFLLLGVCIGGTASAQNTWDTSGNGLLSGSYYVRQVAWVLEDQYGDLGEAVAIYGGITFDGNGNYNFNGQIYDPASTGSNQATNYTIQGTYSISASGYGFMDSLVTNDQVYGLVSNGIFIGSATENQQTYNDLFIAAPIASPQLTNASLNGTYLIADLDNPVTDTQGFGSECCSIYARDSLTTFTADGGGNLKNVVSNGYIAANGGNSTNQNIGSIKYAFSNGAANLFFTGSYGFNNLQSTLMVGNHYLYMSPDGNFVFGGSPLGYDMFVGVKAGSATAANFSGLYYQAGIDMGLNSGGVDQDSYFGSFDANAGGVQAQGLGHQRQLEWINVGAPLDLNYADTYKFNSDGSSDDAGVNFNTGQHYLFANNGAIRIGFGQLPVTGFIGISVALQAPSLNGSGVYLNPTGILNSASSSLFTAGISPGELITLSGSGLAPSPAVTSDFGGSLNGVQVLMNGTEAPLYYVYPTVIAAIVPYEINPGDVVDIQVMNNGKPSNTISTFAQNTQPGVFTNPPGGLGFAITQHSLDYSLVTTSKPAQIGETIVAYLTGLGPVNPSIADGTPGGSSTLNQSTNTISAVIGGVAATVGYSGLVPGLTGLYQMNITIPAGVPNGNVSLDITGPDSYSSESILPVGIASAAISANTTPARRAKPLLRAKGPATRHTPPTQSPARTGLAFPH